MALKGKLQEFALIAEIVSAAAIVGSLVFVGWEIRQNTNAIFATSYDQLVADQMDLRLRVADNPAMLTGFNEFGNAEDANDADTLEYYEVGAYVYGALYQLYERAYFARHYGRLGDEEWNRYFRWICGPDSVERIDRMNRLVFTDEFWEYVHECTGA